MKKFYLLLSAIILLPIIVCAQPSFTERFGYAPSSTNPLEVQSSNTWVGASSGIFVTSGSLAYTGLSNSGNKISFQGNADGVYADFAPAVVPYPGNVYYSFLFRVTAVPTSTSTDGDYFIRLNNGTTTNIIAPIYIRASSTDNTKFNIGYGKRAFNLWLGEDLNPNTTYCVVVCYSTSDLDVTSHSVKLWLNPPVSSFSGNTEPAYTLRTSGAASGNVTNIAAIKRIVIGHGNTNNADMQIDIDEIRIGTTWSEVAVLPVSFNKFLAEVQTNRTRLTWSTFSEQRNSHFEIERSLDGVNFELLTTVLGKGTTSESSLYTIFDNNPSSGTNYYRLSQIDLDGKKTILGTAYASFKIDDVLSFSVYPNPVSSKINMLLKNYQGNFTAALSTLDGRMVYQQQMEATATKPIYLLSLPSKPASGTYVLQVRGSGLSKSVKIFVE